jgi:hypothetical protein
VLGLRQRAPDGDERGDGPRIQRVYVQPRCAGLADEAGQQRGQRMRAGDLVGAVGGEDQDGPLGEVARQDAQQVE